MGSYSSDMLKKAALNDELMNIINTVPIDQRDESWVVIEEYFKRRIKEIDLEHNK